MPVDSFGCGTMWPCPNCEEQLEEHFETCWKCGARQSGERDPAFEVTEPAFPERAPPDADAEATPPRLELPAVSYFAIAVFAWTSFIYEAWNLRVVRFSDEPEDLLSLMPPAIALWIVAMIVIGIPMLVSITRSVVYAVRERELWNPVWLLKMLILPEAIRRNHRWFVPVFYASIVVYAVGPLVLRLVIRRVCMWTDRTQRRPAVPGSEAAEIHAQGKIIVNGFSNPSAVLSGARRTLKIHWKSVEIDEPRP